MSNAVIVIPQKPEKVIINNTEEVLAFRAEGGGIFHVRPRKLWATGKWTRGFTVAYKLKGSRIEVATALQHKADTFCKKVGTKVALQHFREGKVSVLPCKSLDAFREYIAFATS